MKALNNNIDGNLVFNDTYAKIYKTTDNSSLELYGGNTLASEANIQILGVHGEISMFDMRRVRFRLGSTTKAQFGISEISLEYALNMHDGRIENITNPHPLVTNNGDAVNALWVKTYAPGVSTQGDLTVSAPIAISDATRHLIGGAAALSLVNDSAGTITEIDTSAPSASDTKLCTSKSIKDYSDLNLDLALNRSISGNYLKRADDNGFMDINGGSSAYGGLHLQMFGSGYGSGVSGFMRVYVPNAAANGLVLAMQVAGKTDTPTIDMNYNRVVNVGTPTTQYDALNYIPWTTYSSLGHTWGTATPASWTYNFRYTQVGRTCFYCYYGSSADSNGASALTITGLPLASGNFGCNWHAQAFEGYGAGGGTYKDPLAYVPSNTSQIAFLSFAAGTDGQPLYIQVTGFFNF